MSLLGVSYSRSRAGEQAGAAHAGGSRGITNPGRKSPEQIVRERAFVEAHRPIWAWLLRNADVHVVVDPDEQHIVHGWIITSGDDVLHAVGVKRPFCYQSREDAGKSELPPSADLARFMLGDRLRRRQICTLELPQLCHSFWERGGALWSGAIGLARPRQWSIDPTWLLTRMVRAAA